MRLIDADKFLDKLDDEIEMGISDIVEAVNNALGKTPTEDAKPEVHAHWAYNPNANDWGIGGWCCSRCHYKNDILGTSEKPKLPIKMIAGTRFCGQCGATMDEEAEE